MASLWRAAVWAASCKRSAVVTRLQWARGQRLCCDAHGGVVVADLSAIRGRQPSTAGRNRRQFLKPGWSRRYVNRAIPSADDDSVIAEVSNDLDRTTERFDVGLDRG